MKKILLATTVLVGTAGFAAAEVSLSGSARMGLQYTEGSDTVMEYRSRISLTGSGESDGGLAYSATIRLQDKDQTAATQAIGVTVSGAFGSLTFGSESSAAEYAVGDLAGVGYGASAGGSDTAFINGAFAIYSYTAGDLTVYASTDALDSDAAFSVGGKYAAGDLTVGLGYEDNGAGATHTVGQVAYTMGATTLKGIYGVADGVGATLAVNAVCVDNSDGETFDAPTCGTGETTLVAGKAAGAGLNTQMGVSVSHVMDAITVAAYYRTAEVADGTNRNNYGIGAAYDLGGGAAVKGGVQSINETTQADVGLTFSF